MIDRPLTIDNIADIIANGPLGDLQRLPIALSLDPPENVDVEALCFALSRHADGYVRGNAMLGFGHLARVLRRLDRDRVIPVLTAALEDGEAHVRQHAANALSDIEIFLR